MAERDLALDCRRELQEINEAEDAALDRLIAAENFARMALLDYRIARAQQRDCSLTYAEMVAMLDVYTEFGR